MSVYTYYTDGDSIGMDHPMFMVRMQAKIDASAAAADAVNAHGGFGTWASDVVVGEPAMARDVIERHA